jgi:hypothetical protein
MTIKTPIETRCGRCQDSAQTEVITSHFGRERLCIPCAIVVMADRQCNGIEQPPQPPGVAEEVADLKARYG